MGTSILRLIVCGTYILRRGQDLLVANSNHGSNSLYNHTDDHGETEREESPPKSAIGPESSDKDEGQIPLR